MRHPICILLLPFFSSSLHNFWSSQMCATLRNPEIDEIRLQKGSIISLNL
ncbi:hypothetical protein M758_3G260000 [Ceratodon purpureus]|nr:hypothetical protein M758_3G260000 [Ceratodon purpureus]